MATPSGDEHVRYDILIEAKQAIQNLRTIMKTTEDNTTKMQLFSALVLDSAEKWKMSWQKALGVYKQLNAEIAKQKKPTLFGQTGGQDIFGMTKGYLQAKENAGQLGIALDNVATKHAKVGAAAEAAGKKTETGLQRTLGGINILRIALGALVSMILFQVIQAFGTMVREALKGIKELEAATFNLINAEQKLSEAGVEIDTKGLDDLIVKLQKLDPMLSRFQATELVSTLATKVAPAFGLGAKEIDSLATSITILAVRNQALGKSFEEVEQQVITGLLSGKVTAGINQLGLKITDQIVKEKAVELQLVESAKAYDALNAKEQERINVLTIMQILQDDTAKEAENLPKFFQSASGLIGTAQARLSDFLTALGEKFAPLLKTIFSTVINILERLIRSLDENEESWEAFVSFLTLGARFTLFLAEAFLELQLRIGQAVNSLVEFLSQFTLLGKVMKMFFPEKLFPNTPTGEIKIETDEAIQNLDELEQKIEDIIEDTANAREDLTQNLLRKLEDLDTEYQRKAEDAERDFLRTQADINQEYENDVADLRRRHREEDERDEARYQLALWELRQKFLMDLEDALHARDARQVLRLQRQYALDKEALRRKHELEGREREQGQSAEAEDLTRRRNERLAEARREYEQKLADQRIAKAREQEDLAIWYSRELADIAEAQERKMQQLIKGWIDEKKITEENAAEVYGILKKYFGPGGLTDSLYQYMMNSLIASTQGAIAGAMSQMGTIGARDMSGDIPVSTYGNNSLINQGVPPSVAAQISKSSLLPTPKSSMGAPVSITPLSQMATTTGMGRLNGSSNAGVNGQIQIAVDLSPDLEGRIVNKSMDGVADVLTRINRSKV